MKFSKARPAENGQKQQIDIAIPTFGYKNHISIDRRHGVIRKSLVTDAAAHDGARLREGLIDPSNTASDVWADSAYRSGENERFLKGAGKTSRVHRKKPKGRAMPARTRKANAANAVRCRVEHVFASMVVRTNCEGEGHAHAGEYGLQYEPMEMARQPNCVRMSRNGQIGPFSA